MHIPVEPRDPWLTRWLPAIQASALGARVLELGCDTGRDTAVLSAHGLSVTATDISDQALEVCRAAAPGARVLRHDMRDAMPFADGEFGVAIASLCLHYFEWQQTLNIVAEVRRCLAPGGLLLCRLNSTRDVLHGAAHGTETAPGLRVVHGTYSVTKRFFGAADLDALFAAGWAERSREELTVDRYDKPKVLWELALMRSD